MFTLSIIEKNGTEITNERIIAITRSTNIINCSIHHALHFQGGHDYLHAQYMYQFRFKPASKVRAGVLMSKLYKCASMQT